MKKINWEYSHSLNSKSKVTKTKSGVFYGRINHTYKHWDKPGAVQLAVVRFDGNKRTSKVPYEELKFI